MGNLIGKIWEQLKGNIETSTSEGTPKIINFDPIDPRSPVFQKQFERTPLQIHTNELTSNTSTPLGKHTDYKAKRPLPRRIINEDINHEF